MTAFDDLMTYVRETEALSQVAGRLGWDMETVMPPGAIQQRAEENAAMASVLHARLSAPQIGEWLAAAEAPDAAGAAQLRLISREFERVQKVPARLASDLARATARAHKIWAKAREDEDPAAFLPALAEVLAIRREEAACIAGEGGELYDALLGEYEPGAKATELAAIFDALRPGLVELRAAVRGQPKAPSVAGIFEEEAQLALSREVAAAFGYDFERGRIDKAVHPFSSGSGLDVRITTRTSPTDPFNCLYSTIHEVGHATYEQNIDAAYLLTPVGAGVSMGVHESQSRIYENQLGRSRAFTGWLYGRMRDRFGDFGIADEEAFFAAVNAVHDGFIRTEADEVQYNLHVMLRFDLERALISGDLEVADLEAAWNERFLKDFGFAVDKPSHGMLQDVHWSEGLFGYFPTYSLGNVYAGCLHEALRADQPGLDADLAKGDPSAATAWLREKVQRHGGLFEARELITEAIGTAPTEAPLLSYLNEKFGGLYGL
ncbi:carboxypeptidase M32 [Pseudoroseicyclus sp. CXY001]|uniref:carboxypeptidase M32 n=1 Tax=Pseudoroseicyclus sp. CXY001 TaxID=3242492 RepID=UPI00358DB594